MKKLTLLLGMLIAMPSLAARRKAAPMPIDPAQTQESTISQKEATHIENMPIVQEAKMLRTDIPEEQKVTIFNRVAGWLKGQAGCIQGKGCSKTKSYAANFVLGLAYGFVKGRLRSLGSSGLKSLILVPEVTLQMHERAETALTLGRMSIPIVETLAYGYLTVDPKNLDANAFRRYAAFQAGLIGESLLETIIVHFRRNRNRL